MSVQSLNSAHSKSLKPNYKWASAVEYRLIKKIEAEEILTKSIDKTFQIGFCRYGEKFRVVPDFQKEMSLIGQWMSEREKIWKSINRLEKKHNLDSDTVKLKMFQNRRNYSSF